MPKTALKHSIIALLVLIIPLLSIIFWDFLQLKFVYLFTDIGSDTFNLQYPNLLHKSNYKAAEGQSIWWSFNVGMGQNLFNGYKFTLADIPTLFTHHLGIAQQIIYHELFKIISCALLFMLYLHLIGLQAFTVLLGSLLYAFSGYLIVGSSWYVHSSLILNFTLLLVAIALLWRNTAQKSTFFSLGNLLLPFSIYSIGINPELYFNLFFVALYVSYRYYSTGTTFNHLRNFTLSFAALSALGLLLCAPEMVSKIARYLDSPRASDASDTLATLSTLGWFRLESAEHYLTALARLFNTDLLGNGSNFTGWYNYLEAPIFYCGLLTLLLVPQLFTQLNKQQRTIHALFLGFWLILILFPYARYAFYLFLGDYYKTALSLFIPFTLLLFSLKAFDTLLQNRSIHLGVLLISLVSLLIALYLPNTLSKLQVNPYLSVYCALLLLTYSLLLFAWSKRFLHYKALNTIIPLLLLLFICLEIGYFSTYTVQNRSAIRAQRFSQKLDYNDYSTDAIAYIKSIDSSFYRINKTYGSANTDHQSLNDARAQNYYGTTSYASFNQKYYLDFLKAMNIVKNKENVKWSMGLRNQPVLQTWASVKYQLTKTQVDRMIDHSHYRTLKRFGDVSLQVAKYYLPLGFCYNYYLSTDQFMQLLPEQKPLALLKAVIIDKPPVGVHPFSSKQVNQPLDSLSWANTYQNTDTLRITTHRQNHLAGSINLNDPQFLFFSIPYDRGWTATVNGEKQPLQLANIGFMGLALQSGKHDIVLQFKPLYLVEGSIIAIIGLLLYLGMGLMSVYLKYGKPLNIAIKGSK